MFITSTVENTGIQSVVSTGITITLLSTLNIEKKTQNPNIWIFISFMGSVGPSELEREGVKYSVGTGSGPATFPVIPALYC